MSVHRKLWLQFGMRKLFGGILISAVLIVALEFIGGPPVNRSQLRKVSNGMSKEEIISILGYPTVQGESEWVYSRFLNPGWVALTFDERQAVMSIDIECAWRQPRWGKSPRQVGGSP